MANNWSQRGGHDGRNSEWVPWVRRGRDPFPTLESRSPESFDAAIKRGRVGESTREQAPRTPGRQGSRVRIDTLTPGHRTSTESRIAHGSLHLCLPGVLAFLALKSEASAGLRLGKRMRKADKGPRAWSQSRPNSRKTRWCAAIICTESDLRPFAR